MAIAHTYHITKKAYRVELDSGEKVELLVENMHEIALRHEQHEIGRLKFAALSSLNNIDISPLYSLYQASFDSRQLQAAATELQLAAVELFRAYTNGRIRVASDVALSLPAAGAS